MGSTERLARLGRRSDADLAEAALCVCASVEDVDVDAWLLRIDALADALRTSGSLTGVPAADAVALGEFLGGLHGFRGNTDDYYDPANALLTQVLERRVGIPITLAVLYVAIARRVRIPAWGIAMPGHYYVGVGSREDTTVLDAFSGGTVVDHEELAARVRAASGGRIEFPRTLLRAAGPASTTRRILNNLTRDFTNRGDYAEALRTIDCKLVLPNAVADDHRVRGELLSHLGQFGWAAQSYERYLEIVGPDADDADEVRARAIRARARLN